jgi:uncharacterized protein YndB with AHSA1/START domain
MEFGKADTERIAVHEVEREMELPVERDEAWQAVADPERLGEWLAGGGDAEIDLTPGGDLTIGDRIGFVEEVDPGERLVFWWRLPEDQVSTRVAIELDDAEDGTVVRVIETSPLATLDLVGIPLPSRGTRGPTALALA